MSLVSKNLNNGELEKQVEELTSRVKELEGKIGNKKRGPKPKHKINTKASREIVKLVDIHVFSDSDGYVKIALIKNINDDTGSIIKMDEEEFEKFATNVIHGNKKSVIDITEYEMTSDVGIKNDDDDDGDEWIISCDE